MINAAPTMTRKHFEFMADTMGAEIYPSRMEVIADQIAATNPNFNRQKFIDRAEKAWLDAHRDEWEIRDDEIPY